MIVLSKSIPIRSAITYLTSAQRLRADGARQRRPGHTETPRCQFQRRRDVRPFSISALGKSADVLRSATATLEQSWLRGGCIAPRLPQISDRRDCEKECAQPETASGNQIQFLIAEVIAKRMPRKATQVIQPAGTNLTSSSAMSGSKNPLISAASRSLNVLADRDAMAIEHKNQQCYCCLSTCLSLAISFRRVRRLGFAHHCRQPSNSPTIRSY